MWADPSSHSYCSVWGAGANSAVKFYFGLPAAKMAWALPRRMASENRWKSHAVSRGSSRNWPALAPRRRTKARVSRPKTPEVSTA